LEEPLAHTLVDNDKSVFGEYWLLVVVNIVLLVHDLVQLLKLVGNHLGSH